MYVLISFVVSRLSFVLVTDLMRKKKKEKKITVLSRLPGIDFRSFEFDLLIPQTAQHVSVVETVKTPN